MAACVKYLGDQHNRRAVPPDQYPKFGDVLLAALEQFHGANWNETLASEWREVIALHPSTFDCSGLLGS